jgi:hypothetical protein
MLDRRETGLQGLGLEARDARLEVLQRPHLCATASAIGKSRRRRPESPSLPARSSKRRTAYGAPYHFPRATCATQTVVAGASALLKRDATPGGVVLLPTTEPGAGTEFLESKD